MCTEVCIQSICTKQWHGMSYSDRLKVLCIGTLQSRRQHQKLCYLYKIINGQSFFANPPLSYFSSVYNTRSHEFTLNIPFTQSASSFNSFFCDTARLWNHLPYEIVPTPMFISFKKAVSKYLLNS